MQMSVGERGINKQISDLNPRYLVYKRMCIFFLVFLWYSWLILDTWVYQIVARQSCLLYLCLFFNCSQPSQLREGPLEGAKGKGKGSNTGSLNQGAKGHVTLHPKDVLPLNSQSKSSQLWYVSSTQHQKAVPFNTVMKKRSQTWA